MAYILKDEMDQKDVIAIGTETTTPETWNVLGRWADRIIVCAEREVADKVPEKFWGKMIHLNIGRDRWHNSTHPDLLYTLHKKMLEMGRHIDFG
jgi:hypothetical protein